jgi:hypothetical protein
LNCREEQRRTTNYLDLPARFARLARSFAIVFIRKTVFIPAAATATAWASTTAAGATSATTAVGTIAASSAGAKPTRFFRASFIYFNVPATNGRTIESRDRFAGFFVIRHFHESETARTAGFAIHDHANAGDLAERLEQFGQLTLGGLKAHVAYE